MGMEGRQVKLYLGDCLEILRVMEPGSIDAIITDPPYGPSMSETFVSCPVHD